MVNPLYDLFVEWMRACIVPFSLAMVVAPATVLAVLPIGALFALHGSLALADFVAILILSMGLVTPLITIMGYNDDIGKATSIFGEIDSILELPELERPEKSKEGQSGYDVALKEVRFGYKDKEILHGIIYNGDEMPESVKSNSYAEQQYGVQKKDSDSKNSKATPTPKADANPPETSEPTEPPSDPGQGSGSGSDQPTPPPEGDSGGGEG